MANITPIRVAIGLTGRIYAGRVSKDKTRWSGLKWDVTSDVMKAIIDKVGVGQSMEVTVDGKPKFEISIKELSCESTSDAEPASQNQSGVI